MISNFFTKFTYFLFLSILTIISFSSTTYGTELDNLTNKSVIFDEDNVLKLQYNSSNQTYSLAMCEISPESDNHIDQDPLIPKNNLCFNPLRSSKLKPVVLTQHQFDALTQSILEESQDDQIGLSELVDEQEYYQQQLDHFYQDNSPVSNPLKLFNHLTFPASLVTAGIGFLSRSLWVKAIVIPASILMAFVSGKSMISDTLKARQIRSHLKDIDNNIDLYFTQTNEDFDNQGIGASSIDDNPVKEQYLLLSENDETFFQTLNFLNFFLTSEDITDIEDRDYTSNFILLYAFLVMRKENIFNEQQLRYVCLKSGVRYSSEGKEKSRDASCTSFGIG